MTPHPPHVAIARDRCVTYERNFVLTAIRRVARRALCRLLQHDFDLAEGETGCLNIEAKINQSLELNGQDIRSQPALSASLLSTRT